MKKKYFKSTLINIVNALPAWLFIYWINKRRLRARNNPARLYKKSFWLQDDIELEIYWKNIKDVGRGPSLGIHILDKEVLRYDFFGKHKGHFHVFKGNNTSQDFGRIYFIEQNPEEQIKRVIFEIKNNLSTYLKMNKQSRIRNFEIKIADIDEQLSNVQRELTNYIELNKTVREV